MQISSKDHQSEPISSVAPLALSGQLDFRIHGSIGRAAKRKPPPNSAGATGRGIQGEDDGRLAGRAGENFNISNYFFDMKRDC